MVASLVPEQLGAPGTHVLVVGVSAYRHFDQGAQPSNRGELLGMAQLSAAAHSASQFAAWMLQEYRNDAAPLASLRVLLSPVDGEVVHPDILARLPAGHDATAANVEQALVEFKQACDARTDNVAVVYMAGHGVQVTPDGAVLLLHDCGADNHLAVLKASVDLAGVHAAFNHPATAQTQFWFVDCCRQRPEVAGRFEQMAAGLSLDRPLGNARKSAMFMSATTGSEAFARIGGLTLFAQALLEGLRGQIAVPPHPQLCQRWHVSALSLLDGLARRVDALAAAAGAEQSVDARVIRADALFHEFSTVPEADLVVDLLPAEHAAGCIGSLRHGQLGNVLDNVGQWPMTGRFEAGFYEIAVRSPALAGARSKIFQVRPPVTLERLELGP